MKNHRSRRRGIILWSLSGGLALLALQGWVGSVLSSSPFLVTEVELVWPKGFQGPIERYRLHPPASIFKVHLRAVAQALEQQNPLMEVDSVRRVLPNRLVAFLGPKRAYAQARILDRYYLVSEEGRVLLPGQKSPWPHLTVLFLEGLRGSYRSGDSLKEIPRFLAAMELLDLVRRHGGLAGQPARSIRTRTLGDDLILLLDSGLEVRFSPDRLESGWQRLAELVVQRSQIMEEVQYVDLRFGDPVVGGRRGKR